MCCVLLVAVEVVVKSRTKRITKRLDGCNQECSGVPSKAFWALLAEPPLDASVDPRSPIMVAAFVNFYTKEEKVSFTKV